MTGAIRRFLMENPTKFDPREYLKPACEAARTICVTRYQAFGAAGQGSKIKVKRLSEMARRYAAGKMDPHIL
jgi:fructose-bisphosphate aldolase class II